MILKNIALYLSDDDYTDQLATRFGFESRYLCNFVERRLRTLRFHAAGFNTIVVQGKPAPDDSCPIVPESAVRVNVRFDQAQYDGLKRDARHEFLIAMFVEGVQKCARHHDIPIDKILGFVEDFRRGGYKNEWVHQTKLLRGTGLRASLLCSMNSERFALTLKLERKSETVFQKKILQTKPDELIFAYRFKDVVLKGRKILVTSGLRGTPLEPAPPLFKVNISDLELPAR